MRLIEEQGKTMVMVTHDKELAGRIPRKIEIVNGRIAFDSRPHVVAPISTPVRSSVEVETPSRGLLAGLFGGRLIPQRNSVM